MMWFNICDDYLNGLDPQNEIQIGPNKKAKNYEIVGKKNVPEQVN